MVTTEWSRTTKRLVIVGLIIVLLLALYLFRAILPPVAIALVLAYLLKPLVDYVDRQTRLSRTAAVFLVFLVLLLVFSVIPVTIVPYLVDQVTRLNLDLQRLVDDMVVFLSQPITLFAYTISLQDLLGDVRAALQDLVRPFATQTVTLLFGVASSLLWILSILIISFYLIKDADQFRGFLDRIAPPGYTEELRRLREEINMVWKAFFRGQVVLGVIVGVLVWIAMTLVGLPNAGLMALLAGLLEVIPTFGPVLATIPAVLIAFIRGSTYLPLSNFWFAALVLSIYLLIQQAENGYLVPRIMGRRLQLHPVVVFIGVLMGGMVAGVLGVFLAAPIIGTVRVILGYLYAKLLDQVPFPPEEEEVTEVYPGEIDAILFDLDGTLIETDDHAVAALARRLQPLQWILPKRDPDRVARRVLMAGERYASRILALLDRVGLDDDVLGVGSRLRQMRGLCTSPDFRPVDGTVEMLNDLSRRYYIGLVTSRSHGEAQTFLDQQGLVELIQVVVGRDDTWRIKPHPSPVHHAADLLGVRVDRCLVVGDSVVDIEAARAAGARSAAVLCGFGTQDQLERAGADLILVTTGELADWL
jgi:predicted PurR-regulated permease PerM/phosphoglycolate phosphatase-like HAD superfamily hydrolase